MAWDKDGQEERAPNDGVMEAEDQLAVPRITAGVPGPLRRRDMSRQPDLHSALPCEQELLLEPLELLRPRVYIVPAKVVGGNAAVDGLVVVKHVERV